LIHTNVSRRKLLAGSCIVLAGTLAGCNRSTKADAELGSPAIPSAFASMYGPLPNEQFPLPAINLDKIPEQFLRREMTYQTNENVGTIIVDTKNYFLYLIQENGRAIRYGVGLGRAGFEWSGRAFVARKAVWPTWTPPEDMIARQPELEQWSWKNGGMPAGLDNPLGARALYIYQGNKDTLYRLNGTAEIWSIGKAVSSGCVRMLNQDIIDLHRRVPNQTPIVVL